MISDVATPTTTIDDIFEGLTAITQNRPFEFSITQDIQYSDATEENYTATITAKAYVIDEGATVIEWKLQNHVTGTNAYIEGLRTAIQTMDTLANELSGPVTILLNDTYTPGSPHYILGSDIASAYLGKQGYEPSMGNTLERTYTKQKVPTAHRNAA